MKRVMLLGGGLLQTYVVKKINELGYDSVCIDMDKNSLGFKYSKYHEVINIIDSERCLEYAKTMKIDAVLTAATDYGVLSASYIAEKMGLIGLNYDTAKIIKNKFLTRKIINNASWQFFEISDTTQLKRIADEIKYPVILKPCDGSGSKGVLKVEKFDDLIPAFEIALKNSLIKKVLIESFIKGQEYGVESIVSGGEIKVLAIMYKTMAKPPVYAELGHCVPCLLEKGIEKKIREEIRNAIKKLGINTGCVNMDFILTKDNEIYIIDIGARMGGNLIGSHIVPLATGIDYMAAMINTALNGSSKIEPAEKTNVASRIFDFKPGTVNKMPDLRMFSNDNNVNDIVLKISSDSQIKEYVTNIEGCGYAVCTGVTPAEAVNKAQYIRDYIYNNIDYKNS